MAEASGNWIVVRDAERLRIFEDCSHWDYMTFLGALSSDPRNWEELGIAWSRYHPTDSWHDIAWRDIEQLPVAVNDDSDYLIIDLGQQIYATAFDEASEEYTAGLYCSQECPERLVWINIPPWWQPQSIPIGSQVEWHSPHDNLASDKSWCSLRPVENFRDVLFGSEFLEYAADKMLAQGQAFHRDKPVSATVKRSSRKRRRAVSKAKVRERRAAVSTKEALQVIRQAHADWLMTPRESLNGWTPRECLHWQRHWKDAELDFRRAQWSRERRPPPAVPIQSHLFLSGPMGIEEVVCYFEFCRELLSLSLRWVLREPTQTRAALVYALMNQQQLLLEGPASDGGGQSLRETLRSDRQLMPLVASAEPIDCDCPLCRMQASQSGLFGPAFMICDGLHLEMEDEFAFSLYADREEWELMRDPWLDDSPSTALGESPARENVDGIGTGRDGKRNRYAARRARAQARSRVGASSAGTTVLAAVALGRDNSVAQATVDPGKIIDPQSMSNDDSGPTDSVWKSSFVTPTSDPRLSLFSIGARLGELIELLKAKQAPRTLIDRLNNSFDELSAGTGNWLMGKVDDKGSPSASIELGVRSMLKLLEEVTGLEPTLTGHSADLQSLVDQWQRQLLTR